MAALVGNYPRIIFPESGVPLEGLSPQVVHEHFGEALALANRTLLEEGIVVRVLHQCPREPETAQIDPQRNIVLGIEREGEREPIDIVDIKALDEHSLKPVEELADGIAKKARQHVVAKRTEGVVVIPSSGTKYDPRMLREHQFTVDAQGYMKIDAHRIVFGAAGNYSVLKAERLRTYTICRLAEEGRRVRLFDDYDLVRQNRRGMEIDPKVLLNPDLLEMHLDYRGDAAEYNGSYLKLERNDYIPPLIERMIAIYREFPDTP